MKTPASVKWFPVDHRSGLRMNFFSDGNLRPRLTLVLKDQL